MSPSRDWIAERSEWADTPNLCSACRCKFMGHRQRHLCVACADALREENKQRATARKRYQWLILLLALMVAALWVTLWSDL